MKNTTLTLAMILACAVASTQSEAADGRFVNLSTRALVETGDEVMIGGFIIKDGSLQVLIQAIGPELAERGIPNALADPVLTVINATVPANPVELMVNNNWEDTQGQLVSDLWGGNPNLTAGSLSSAAVLTLDPGNYTTKIEGKNGSAGVAIVEVYAIDSAGAGNPDREALTALYNATGSRLPQNWLSDMPLDQWAGVKVDENGRVTELEISFNDLSGPIPAELGNLTKLTSLHLYDNQLSGPIPVELGNLTELEVLFLGINQLSSPIPPELGNLANLVGLHLSDNQLSGSIPVELGNLTKLRDLILSSNEVCVPDDATLRAFLDNLYRITLPSCE